MQYDAVILAGGESTSDLKKIAPYDNEALIIIGQYPMIYYVYRALKSSPYVRNIIISGPSEALRSLFGREENLFFVNRGEDAVESLIHAVDILEQQGTTDQILVLPTDVPFITPEAINDFISRCQEVKADFYYPVTSREVNEKKYPGVMRTYVKLREGTFTGGNLFMVRSKTIKPVAGLFKQLLIRRKNPLAMARLFGLNLVCKFMLGRLSIRAAEKRFQEVTSVLGRAIISPYAEIGVDVDKPSDLKLAQQYLSGITF